MIEIDSNFIGKDASFKFDVIGSDTINRKIFIESSNFYRAVIKDTSQEVGNTIVRVSYKDALIYVGKRWLLVSKLFSDDAQNGNLRRKGIMGRPFEIRTPLFYNLNRIPEFDDNATIKIIMSRRVQISTDINMVNKWGDFKAINKDLQVLKKSWGEYKKTIAPGQSLYFVSNCAGKETVSITLYWPRKIFKTKEICPQNRSITENITFTTIADKGQIVLEPITNEIVPNTLSEVYNPACVVVNGNASFKIEVDGRWFKQETVKWRSENRLVKFLDNNGLESDIGTGLTVKVIGKVKGDDALKVEIEGYGGVKPRIDFSVVDPVPVKLTTYMIKNDKGDSAWTDVQIDNVLDTVNDILKQVGVNCYRDKQNGPTGDEKYFNITTASAYEALYNSNVRTDGLELYLMKSVNIPGNNMAAGNVVNYGIIFPKESGSNKLSARDLAHEIMHSARQNGSNADEIHFKDIYIERKTPNKFRVFVTEKEKVEKNKIPDDIGSNYYKKDELQINIIKRLLQYGTVNNKDAIDIPRGDIYGLDGDVLYTKRLIECGYLKVSDRILVHMK